MYKGYTRIYWHIPVCTVYTVIYCVHTGIYQSVHIIYRYIPVCTVPGQVPKTFSVYTVLYFLTNSSFILSYTSVLRHLYDRNCPECMCQLSREIWLYDGKESYASLYTRLYTSITVMSIH